MAGKSPVVASAAQRLDLMALSHSRDRGEADRARALLLTLAGWTRPELNDIEELWRNLKRHHLAHQTFAGPDNLDCAIHEAVMMLNRERNRHPLASHRTAA